MENSQFILSLVTKKLYIVSNGGFRFREMFDLVYCRGFLEYNFGLGVYFWEKSHESEFVFVA